jgi:hypothetical protein
MDTGAEYTHIFARRHLCRQGGIHKQVPVQVAIQFQRKFLRLVQTDDDGTVTDPIGDPCLYGTDAYLLPQQIVEDVDTIE